MGLHLWAADGRGAAAAGSPGDGICADANPTGEAAHGHPQLCLLYTSSFTNSLDLACKQVKTIYSMTCTYKDIRNAIINIATYSKAMINDGASSYKLNQDEVTYIEILELALRFKANDDNALRVQLGESVCNFLDTDRVFNPLSDAYSRIQNFDSDPKAPILYAANAFESFLHQIEDKHSISLSGRSGIGQKSDALNKVISVSYTHLDVYKRQVLLGNFIGNDFACE